MAKSNFKSQLARFIIASKKSYFLNVLGLIEEIEKKQEEDYKSTVAKFEKENPEPDITGYSWQDYMGDFGYEQEQTIQILYKSFVVSIIMFMESQLLELCQHLQKEFDQKFSVHDLGSGGVNRSIKYLKILGIEFPKNIEVKNGFALAFRIRNNLVHADGRINNEEELQKLLGSNKDVQQKIKVHDKELDFSKDYLTDLIDLNEKVCDEISNNWLVKEPWP